MTDPRSVLPLWWKVCCQFLSPIKILAGFEPAKLGSSGNHYMTEVTQSNIRFQMSGCVPHTCYHSLTVSITMEIYMHRYNIIVWQQHCHVNLGNGSNLSATYCGMKKFLVVIDLKKNIKQYHGSFTKSALSVWFYSKTSWPLDVGMYETYNKDTYKFCIVQITLFMMGLSDVISENLTC